VGLQLATIPSYWPASSSIDGVALISFFHQKMREELTRRRIKSWALHLRLLSFIERETKAVAKRKIQNVSNMLCPRTLMDRMIIN
jgi:hypothetical protein